MTDDIVTRLREGKGNDIELFGMMFEAADEIERLRGLIKSFVHEWEQSELGARNGFEYFASVHQLRNVVRGE